MTRIRSVIAAGLMVFAGATIVAAQQPAQQQQTQQVTRHAKGHGRKADARLLKGMTLSSTERASMKGVRQKYAAQFKALRGSNTVDKSQVRALRQSEQTDLRDVLSSANQSRFDANVAAMKHRGARGGSQVKP